MADKQEQQKIWTLFDNNLRFNFFSGNPFVYAKNNFGSISIGFHTIFLTVKLLINVFFKMRIRFLSEPFAKDMKVLDQTV